jgi:hypothetical protein
MNGSEIANNYAAVSFVIAAIGIGSWLAGWRDTTRLLPWNRARLEKNPIFRKWTLALQRISVWLIVIGASNLVLALIVVGLVS